MCLAAAVQYVCVEVYGGMFVRHNKFTGIILPQ